jgi:hypothetical protein
MCRTLISTCFLPEYISEFPFWQGISENWVLYLSWLEGFSTELLLHSACQALVFLHCPQTSEARCQRTCSYLIWSLCTIFISLSYPRRASSDLPTLRRDHSSDKCFPLNPNQIHSQFSFPWVRPQNAHSHLTRGQAWGKRSCSGKDPTV